MSRGWAVHLSLRDAGAAFPLRLHPAIRAAVVDADLWLRGDELPHDLEIELRKIPRARRFDIGDDDALVPVGARIPTGVLPSVASWQPLASLLSIVPQPAALCGQLDRRASLTLVRTSRQSPATVLLTSLAHWAAYASSAPLVRLRPLRFAASTDGRVVIRGAPLPPLPGVRYVEQEGVATPAGWAFSPPLDVASVRILVRVAGDDLALFAEDASCERIPAEAFVAASRGGARATLDAMAQNV